MTQYSEAFDRNEIALRIEVPTVKVPTLEEWEQQVRDRRQRAHTALERATDALGRLRALPGALGAVARLHVPRGGDYDRWGCDGCEACCDTVAWPCSTVVTIADELGIPLPEYFDLPASGVAEPLDDPIPPLPDSFLGLAPGTDYFIRLPMPPTSFAFLRDVETVPTILDPD